MAQAHALLQAQTQALASSAVSLAQKHSPDACEGCACTAMQSTVRAPVSEMRAVRPGALGPRRLRLPVMVTAAESAMTTAMLRRRPPCMCSLRRKSVQLLLALQLRMPPQQLQRATPPPGRSCQSLALPLPLLLVGAVLLPLLLHQRRAALTSHRCPPLTPSCPAPAASPLSAAYAKRTGTCRATSELQTLRMWLSSGSCALMPVPPLVLMQQAPPPARCCTQ